MKNITGFLKILLFNLLVFTGLLAQDTTYVRLDDAGGTIFSNYELEQLELYADSLRLDLPEQYRADFKVYDFGFYRHLEVYGEYGFEEAFEELKPTIKKPYYLLIARQSDKSGMNTKVFVEFKLPEDNNYPCASSAYQESSCNIFKYSFNNTSGSAGIRILSGLKEIHGLTSNIYSCCDFSEGETTCDLSANEVGKILVGAGYMNYNGLQIDVTGVDGISEIVIHMDERCPITQAKAYDGPHSLFSSEYQYTIGDEFHLLAELNDFKSAMEDMNIVVDIPAPLVINSPPSFFVDFYSDTGGKDNFDYKEKIVVLQIPGQPVQVYTKIEIRPEAFNTGEFNPEWSLFQPKKIFSWFVRRSATNPTTVLFGVALDYFIDGTFSYFFDQSKYDTYWIALYSRFLQQGITGLGIKLLTNIIDSPASIFIGQIAEYMISTDYDDWNLPQVLGTALTGTILQGSLSISAKAGKFIKPFLGDVVSNAQGAKMLAHCFWDRRLVKAWKDLIAHPFIRKDITSLTSVSKILDNTSIASVISKTELQTVVQNLAQKGVRCRTCTSGNPAYKYLDEVLDDLEHGAVKFGDDYKPVVRGFKHGGNFTEGAMFVADAVKRYGNDFPTGTVFEFVEVTTGGVRRVDVRVGNVFYEFKSVASVPPKGFATQFIKDMDLTDVVDLSQLKWWFDGKKVSSLPKQQFLDQLNAASIDPSIISKLLPNILNPTKSDLLQKISQDFDKIFLIK